MRLSIAAAQTVPVKDNVKENLDRHLYLIGRAAAENVRIITFPEMSLTGYERRDAKKNAFRPGDERLKLMIEAAATFNINVIVGAPIYMDPDLFIGSFIIRPERTVTIYTKHFLHSGEKSFFKPWMLNPSLVEDGIKISFAICADITHEAHREKAFDSGSKGYLASVFITPEGYRKEAKMMKNFARESDIFVAMANFGGKSGGFSSAGKSAIWSSKGDLVSMMKDKGEGLAIATVTDQSWSGKVIHI